MINLKDRLRLIKGKTWLIALGLLVLVVIILKLTGPGDVESSTEAWDKVGSKSAEVKEMFDYATLLYNKGMIASGKKDYALTETFLVSSQKRLVQTEKLLTEEDRLISEFGGTTVKLRGDAKKYGEETLTNMREAHKLTLSAVEALKASNGMALDYLNGLRKEPSRNEVNAKLQEMDSIIKKQQDYISRAMDASNKLKALE